MKYCKFLIVFFLLERAQIGFCYAQNIYELKIQFYIKDDYGNWQKSNYDQFLIFYYSPNSEKNIARNFIQGSYGKRVVEQKLFGFKSIGDDDEVKLKLTGQNPQYITDCSDSDIPSNEKYYPDTFYFSKAADEPNYRPTLVDDTVGHRGKIISFKVLRKEDITDDYLEKWCWKL